MVDVVRTRPTLQREHDVGQGFQLVFQVAEGPVVRQFDQARVVLGRSMVCDVVFDSPHISRKHAEIVRDAGGWIVQDLRSRQGVAVNGQRVARQTARARRSDCPGAGCRGADAAWNSACRNLPIRLPPQAILSDESGPTSVVASIDLRELSNTLDQSGRGKQATIELHAGDAAGKGMAAPDAPGRDPLRKHVATAGSQPVQIGRRDPAGPRKSRRNAATGREPDCRASAGTPGRGLHGRSGLRRDSAPLLQPRAGRERGAGSREREQGATASPASPCPAPRPARRPAPVSDQPQHLARGGPRAAGHAGGQRRRRPPFSRRGQHSADGHPLGHLRAALS